MLLVVFRRPAQLLAVSLILAPAIAAPTPARGQVVLVSELTLDDPGISDQDDMCIWVHPVDRSLSTIITSDKAANRLFVYDLSGRTLQVVSISGQPGNIDLRYNFVLGGVPTDIVAFNDRTNNRIQVYKVNPSTRQLSRVDNNAISTGANYGFTLYRSMVSGDFYAFTTSESGGIKQFRLSDQAGKVAGTQVRSWSVGSITEGCAADDLNATVFFAQETRGVWKVGAEPGAPTPGSLIARVGDESGLEADVEGITVYHGAGNGGYLLVSSQGSNEFKVYGLKAPHNYVETFSIEGVSGTDGVDVTNVSLGQAFPFGLIAVHNDSPSNKPVEVCGFEGTNLSMDTQSWDPRSDLTLDAPEVAESVPAITLASYPNPITHGARIRFRLPSAQYVELDVLDVAGRIVATLASGRHGAGDHEVEWGGDGTRGRHLPSGLYLIRMRAGGRTVTNKAIIAD